MWIQREIESYLRNSATQWAALLITGARQTGKTSLLKRVFPDANYVSLDLPSEAEQAERDAAFFLSRYPSPVIIDEVQYAPGIFRYLKIAIDADRARKGQFLLTGSQRFELMQGVQESLAGRLCVLELEPLSVFEAGPQPLGSREVVGAMLRGGFPELHIPGSPSPSDYFRSYVASYLERDLKIVLNVTDIRDFERFLRACAVRSGSLLNKSDLARDVGISVSTASEWIGALVTSGIVQLLEPWFSNISRTLAKSPKLYFTDTGLLCYLLNLRTQDDLLASPNLGGIWETFVLAEIRRRQLSGTGEARINFYRDRAQEVDFLIPQGDRLHLVEVKWKELPTREDGASLEKLMKTLGRDRVASASLVSRAANSYPVSEAVRVVPFGEIYEVVAGR